MTFIKKKKLWDRILRRVKCYKSPSAGDHRIALCPYEEKFYGRSLERWQITREQT